MSDVTILGLGLVAIFAAFALVLVILLSRRPATSGVARQLAVIEQMAGGSEAMVADQSFKARMVVPFAVNMRALAARLSPSGSAATMQHRLDVAGNPRGLTPDQLLAMKGLALVAGLVFGGLVGARHGVVPLTLLAAAFGAFAFFVPDLLVYNSGIKRQDEIRKTLPDALDMLTVSVEAGLGFDAALAQVARNTTGPLAGEFFRVLKEMQIGQSRVTAFLALRERTTVDELHVFVSALVQADKQGIPVASVLREQSREMRLKRQQRAEEAAAKVPVKILFPLIFCIFPVMFIVIIGPGAIQIVRSFTGRL
jgi:tight adherence protein C